MVHLFDRKVPSRTNSSSGIDFPVDGKSYLLSNYVRTQVAHQLSKSHQLFASRPGLFKVADQANTYAHFINVLAMNVSTFQLFKPSMADLNLAVVGIHPVADYKMVRQTVFHAALTMCPVVYCRIAVLDRTMMTNDPLPTTGWY